MSEIKAHRFITTDELFPEANAGALYYDKAEADKVIAEKDAIIEEQAKEIKFMQGGEVMAKTGSKYKIKEPAMSNKKSWEVVIQRYTDADDHFLFDFDAKFDTIIEEVFGTYEALGKAVRARNFLINESRSGGDAFGLSRINAVYIRSKR